jgi:tetratricopeptide (TPR) repeat protein
MNIMQNALKKFFAIFLLLLIAAAPLLAQPQPNQAALDQADKFFQDRDWANAAKAYEAITKKEPSNFQVCNRLGSSWHSLGQYDKAAAAYEKLSPNAIRFPI